MTFGSYKGMRIFSAICLAILLKSPILRGQAGKEILLTSENAYNPIPSPDGKLIAYVRTGWGREGGSGGFGRSNLVSEVAIFDSEGKPMKGFPSVDSFLAGWSSDGQVLVLYRDLRYRPVTLDGKTVLQGQLRGPQGAMRTERVFYLRDVNEIGWSRVGEGPETVLETSTHTIARHAGWIGENVVPSPSGRYLAVFGSTSQTELFVYDLKLSTWSDLGPLTVHPDPDRDYMKPTWSPWFTDSSRLAFVSSSTLVISDPQGKSRRTMQVRGNPGLAAPSPDGHAIAYVTIEPTPMKERPDLFFYGGTTIWIQPLALDQIAVAATKSSEKTYDLRWLNNTTLIFDRIEDAAFAKHLRLWKVSAPRIEGWKH